MLESTDGTTRSSAITIRNHVATLRQQAHKLAAAGLPVIPLQYPRALGPGLPDLVCSCAAGPRCASPAKHPANRSGARAWIDADHAEWIDVVWSARPWNIGVVLDPAEVLVVDMDSGAAVRRWRSSSFGNIPTLSVVSGRIGGGLHVYFRQPPGQRFRSIPQRRVQRAHPGWTSTEVKGAGGYVVAAGSVHVSGRVYSLVNPTTSIAEVPDDLLEWLVATGAPSGTTAVSRCTDRERSGQTWEVRNAQAYAHAVLAELAHAVPGNRNNAAAGAALALRDIAEEGCYSLELLRAWFFSAAGDCGLLEDEPEQTYELWCRLTGNDCSLTGETAA